jgi:hypothetical protein
MRKRNTSRQENVFKPCMFCTQCVYSKLTKWELNEPRGAHFSSGDPRKFEKQIEYDAKTKFYKEKHSIIKSVNSWMSIDISV